ncbi:hypothetical protein SK128_009002 [Halocaridina rubra]|uniref:Sulfotransferase n=1 Tax=Halocaridina rubra TaxID=373956 RepID=A0AAN8WTH7_HALRR
MRNGHRTTIKYTSLIILIVALFRFWVSHVNVPLKCYSDEEGNKGIEYGPTALELQSEHVLLNFISKRTLHEPLFIIVLADSGRVGSSLLAELLSSDTNTILFFEPLFKLNKSPKLENGTFVSQFLEKVLNCTYDDKFEKWFKYHVLFRRFYHPVVKDCQKTKNETDCVKHVDFRGLCKASTVRIIKVIRSPLMSVEKLLNRQDLNLRILHLQRDPRAALSSINKIGWKARPQKICTQMLANTLAFEAFVQKHPSKLHKVRYEDLCQYPRDTVSKIYSFLWNNSTIPEPVVNYIASHMETEKNVKGPMSRTKDSKNEAQAWRREIKDTLFMDAEKEFTCRMSIERYGHRVFWSVVDLRNPKIPIALYEDEERN